MQALKKESRMISKFPMFTCRCLLAGTLICGTLAARPRPIKNAAPHSASAPEGALSGVENEATKSRYPKGFVVEADAEAGVTFHDADAAGSVAAGTTGACCLPACGGCVANQTLAQCNTASGAFQGLKTLCADDICGCLTRACCSPAGVCTGDVTRTACEGGGGYWNSAASCVGAGNRPLPICNQFAANNCNWDNGLPLNDGGASRAHTHSGGAGQLPRYDFSSADDFILGGPDSDPCQIGTVRWFFRARPSDTAGPVFTPPNPAGDIIGINVTVYRNFVHPQTGINQPGGQGLEPVSADDLNPKTNATPGGIVYARTFFTNSGNIVYTQQPLGCDPPPANGLERAEVYEAEITVDPPILLNKNLKYWLDVQGVFPFNDGLRETLQTWAMPSVNNTLLTARGYRTTLGQYFPVAAPSTPCTMNSQCAAFPAGFCSGSVCHTRLWEPIGPGFTQAGNQGAPAPCANVPAGSRRDFSFQLEGVKDLSLVPDNDLCANAINAFDGVNPFGNTAATTGHCDPSNSMSCNAYGDCPMGETCVPETGPASCGVIAQDLWFTYTATCTGVMTVSTCDSDFDSIVAVYDNPSCPSIPVPSVALPNEDTAPPGRTPTAARARIPSRTPSAGILSRDKLSPSQSELACADNTCSDDAQVQTTVTEGAQYTIRVGGVDASQGQGLLTIDCQETCGNPAGGDCCTVHGPPGCLNDACCEVVCATPGREYCCENLLTGWDQACADTAALTPACHCPCAFTCPGGSQIETEGCGANTNGGCNNIQSPETFEPLGMLVVGTPKSVCATLRAASNSRDTDWWLGTLPDTASGLVTLNMVANGSAPMSALVFIRAEPADLAAGETFCIDKVCSGATSCQTAVTCTAHEDCNQEDPTATCETVGTTLLLFDAIATASCQPTDGLGTCDPLVTCLPDDQDVVIVVTTAAADGECNPGDGIFTGIACGGTDDYGFTLTLSDDCADGACCTFTGGCEDGSPGIARNEYECFLAGGSFAGEGVTCEALPLDIDCADLAHGCAAAQVIGCGGMLLIDLTTDDHLPEEPYPCGDQGNNPNDRAWVQFTTPCVDDNGNGANNPDNCNDQPGTDTTSVRVSTCNSVNPGRDSLLALFGSCCPISGVCPDTGNACDEGTFCGGICSAEADFAMVGCGNDDCGFTDLLGALCATELIEGETYYIQISNGGEPVNGIYTLELDCPCIGSCCDATVAVCTDDVPDDQCQPPLTFDSQKSCAELSPACGVGACCRPNGTCVNATLAGCQGTNENHILGVSCSSTVCNVYNTCDYNTGDPRDCGADANFGFRSQFAEDIGLFVEVADQFELDADPGHPCFINSIEYTTFHTSHDTTNGLCAPDGGSACSDRPFEYDGIIVTISKDLDGVGKGPTCAPVCTATECTPGPDGDYHDDENIAGCYSYAFGEVHGESPPPAGNYWTYEKAPACDPAIFWMTLHFQPALCLEKEQKYWLAITHIWRDIAGYSIIPFASNNFNGNYSQRYNSQTIPLFQPLDGFPNDMLFAIDGVNVGAGCGVCELFGDVAPQPAAKCLIDVDDILCALDSFAGPGTYCGDNLLGDIVGPGMDCGSDGIVDVDDLLAVLFAFRDLFYCPDPCSPGACIGDFDHNPATPDECRDGSYSPHGMSESDCFDLGTDCMTPFGHFCGQLTQCGDPGCTP